MTKVNYKPRILVVSHGASATGFSRIADGIIQNLKDEYEFHQFASNHRIDRIDGRWPIYGNPYKSDAYGLDRLGMLTKKIKPHIILILNDLWFCCMHIQRLIKIKNRPLLIGYCPVDGILTRPELYSGLALFDQIVAYNHFGENEVRKIYYKDIPLSAHGLLQKISIIPHGLDIDTFYPLQPDNLIDRTNAKHKFFGKGIAKNGFIVLNASKHQLRKRLDLTIKGFALFAKDKPIDVKLYLHTGATFDGPDIRVIAEQEGISDRLINSAGWLEDHPAIGNEKLNLLYNATDVGINSSMGEGWGLVSFEHAATGAPQIIPDHSACKELWQDVDTMLPVKKEIEHKGLAMMWNEIDPKDIAGILNKLYNDRDFRMKQAEKSYNNAIRNIYRWDKITAQWDKLFQQLLDEKSKQKFISPVDVTNVHF